MSRFAGFRDLSIGIGVWIAIIVGILIVVWVIFGVIAGLVGCGEAHVPNVDKAKYEVFIRANARTLYTNDFTKETNGNYDILILNGYYEFQNNDFKYHDKTIVLDERTFGRIEISKRNTDS